MLVAIPQKYRKPLLTGDEVADMLGMKNRSLHRFVMRGELMPTKRGNEVADMIFKFDEVIAFKAQMDARRSSLHGDLASAEGDPSDMVAYAQQDTTNLIVPPKFNRPTLNGGEVALFLGVSFRTLYGFIKRRELTPTGHVTKELRDMTFKLKDVVQMKLTLDDERKKSPVQVNGAPTSKNDGVQAVRMFERPAEVLTSSVTLPPQNPKYRHVTELATIGDVLRAKAEEFTEKPVVDEQEPQAEIIQMPEQKVLTPEPVQVLQEVPADVVNVDVETPAPQPIAPPQPEEDMKHTEMLTSEQARAIADMPAGTFYGRVNAGHLPFKTKDGKKMFRKDDVLSFKELFAEASPKKVEAAKKPNKKPSKKEPLTVEEQGKKFPNLAKAWEARRKNKEEIAKPKPSLLLPKSAPTGMRVVIYRPETVKLPEVALKQLFKIFPFDHEKTTLILGKAGIDKLNVLAMLYEGPAPNPYEQIIAALTGDLRVELAVDA